MSTIQIHGLRPLKGEVVIQGSKNAVLPIMAAAILHKGVTVLTNVPGIQDVFCMMGILEYMGCKCRMEEGVLTIDASEVDGTGIPEQYVKAMRSSIMLLGPMLGRLGEAMIHYPGGCSIGKRPIDLHLYVLEQLGASVMESEEQIMASTAGLEGTEIHLAYPSVGATENAVMAAVLAAGDTRIYGGALEPEIEELCRFLNGMGAGISLEQESVWYIRGGAELHDSVHRVCADRIVTGTYLAAASIAGGEVFLRGGIPSHLSAVLPRLQEMGNLVRPDRQGIWLRSEGRPNGINLKTEPYPGFPTDLQSPFMAVLSTARGRSCIEENVFEARYETAGELKKMGADIEIKERSAYIEGRYPLYGTKTEAKDLRGGAALVIAGLAAEGMTEVTGCHHMERGYEEICRDLQMLGAEIGWK